MNKDAILGELERHREKAEEVASRELAKPRKTAKTKFLKKMDRAFEYMIRDAEDFNIEDYNEKKASVQEKYSQRMYNNLIEVIEKVQKPEVITLRALDNYIDEIDELIMDLNDIFRKYVKLLDRTFTAKVRTLDKSFRFLFKEKEKLRKFVDKKYRPKSHIEGSIWEIDDIVPLIEDFYSEIEKITSLEEDVKSKTEQMDAQMVEIDKLRNHELKKVYEDVQKEFSDYQRKFDEQLSDIRKALRKYINKKSKEKNSGDLSFMKEFVSDSATTLATSSSLSNVTSLLNEIKTLLETNQLELKKDRKESALKSIENLLGGELEELYKVAKKSYDLRNETKQKLDDLGLDKQISKLEQVYEGLKRDRLRLVEREIREAHKLENEIKKNLKQLNERYMISVETKLDDIPKLGLEVDTVLNN